MCIENTLKYITEFLKVIYPRKKEEFIEYYTEIYFPSLKLIPIEWLEQTVETLKQAIKVISKNRPLVMICTSIVRRKQQLEVYFLWLNSQQKKK